MDRLTLPESIEIPQASPLQSLLGGLGTGLEAGVPVGLQQLLATQQAQQKLESQTQRAQQGLELYKQLTGQGVGQGAVQDGLGVVSPEQRDVGFERVLQSQAQQDFPSAESIAALTQVDPNLAKVAQQERKEGLRRSAADKKLAFDETRDARKELTTKARKAKDFDLRLDRMDELIAEGKLISPIYNSMLEKFGFDIPALKNPQSQEFDKLVSDLTRDIRARFGARITNFELKIFLKSIPGLSQTDEGKKRVVHNLRLLNEADIVRNQAKSEIIRRNGGIPPIDLEDQVEEVATPRLNRIAEDFKTGLAEETPPVEAPQQFTIGQEFKSLPSTAPEGAIVSKGNQTFIFRNGKWRKR